MSVLKRFLSSAARVSSSFAVAVRGSASLASKASALLRSMTATPTIVLSGPSGSGKSTLLNKAMTQYPGKFAFGISHTTRSPRPGEIDGVHYNFTDIPTMKKMIENGEFYEHAEFTGNLYGTSKKTVEDIQKSGKVCVLDVDLQGVRNFKRSPLVAKYILIAPPEIEDLKNRLKERGTETEESIAHRIKRAKEDMKAVKENAGLFDYVVVNDELDEAYGKFMNVINEDLEQLNNNQIAA